MNTGCGDRWRDTGTLCGSFSTRHRPAGRHPPRPKDHEVVGQRPVLDVADVDAHGLFPRESEGSLPCHSPARPDLTKKRRCMSSPDISQPCAAQSGSARQVTCRLKYIDQLRRLIERVPTEDLADSNRARLDLPLLAHSAAVAVRSDIPTHAVAVDDRAREPEQGEPAPVTATRPAGRAPGHC